MSAYHPRIVSVMKRYHPLLSLDLAGRITAALFGGYALAFGSTAFLSVYLPLARADRVVTASLLCFAVWVAAVIYTFAARSALRAWLWLGALTVLLCLAAYLPVEWRSRP
tara:strand:- start:5127 stop:5456 length:330 start_codon:yes stop_codon:yes gene_type:complete